jgi:hypothetical protein
MVIGTSGAVKHFETEAELCEHVNTIAVAVPLVQFRMAVIITAFFGESFGVCPSWSRTC